ncbi:unnamed protein product [Arctogadus glacialis]
MNTGAMKLSSAAPLCQETVGGAQRGPQRVRPLGLHGVFVVKRHVIISNLCPQELPNASLDDSNVSTQAESPEEVVPVFPQDQRFLGFQLHPFSPAEYVWKGGAGVQSVSTSIFPLTAGALSQTCNSLAPSRPASPPAGPRSAPTTLSQDIRGRGPSVSGVFVPSQRDRSDVRHNDLLRGFSGPAGTHCRRERKYQGGEEPKNEQIRHAPRQ